MATASDLIKQFEFLYRTSPPYVWGGLTLEGMDCSGAFVWAFKRLGLRIAHGSNTIARSYVVELVPILHAEPGMAAFKVREPGQPGYDLPEKFKPGGSAYNGDLRDYYHIGLIDETGRYVYNAQSKSAGFVRSRIREGWTHCARLKAIDYERDDPMVTMIVAAENGGKVNVRREPSTTSAMLTRLPCGTAVQAGEDVNGWRQIQYTGGGAHVSGYMMSEFLVPFNESIATPSDLPSAGLLPETESVIIQLPLSAARAVLDALVKVLGVG